MTGDVKGEASAVRDRPPIMQEKEPRAFIASRLTSNALRRLQ
jgi:hypothetical protein